MSLPSQSGDRLPLRLPGADTVPDDTAYPLETTPPWIDPSHLQAIVEGLGPDDALACLTNLRSTVISDYQSMRPRLAAACATKQTLELAALMHGLKSCVFALGWARLGRRCIDVITDLRADRFDAWSGLPGEFDRLFHDSTLAFDAALGALLPAAAAAARPHPSFPT